MNWLRSEIHKYWHWSPLQDAKRLPVWWNKKVKIFGNLEATNKEIYGLILVISIMVNYKSFMWALCSTIEWLFSFVM